MGRHYPVDPFVSLQPIDGSVIINREGEVVVSNTGLTRPFDQNGLAWLGSDLSNASSIFEKTSWVKGVINTKGEMIIKLEGGEWIQLGQSETDTYIFRDLFPSPPDYYVASTNSGDLKGHWVQAYWRKIQGWLRGESLEEHAVCHCYYKDGTLIWSSAQLSYEAKCIFVLVSALILAFFVRPKRKRDSKAKESPAP